MAPNGVGRFDYVKTEQYSRVALGRREDDYLAQEDDYLRQEDDYLREDDYLDQLRVGDCTHVEILEGVRAAA